MRNAWWVPPLWAACGLALLSSFYGCGSDANLTIAERCAGGNGPEIRGVVRMPNGRVARTESTWERIAGQVWSAARAISGDVQPVGSGVEVALVELRPEDPHGDPGAIEVVATNADGEYCLGLPDGTDANVCRYVLQVGSADDGTLTRAFVYSSDGEAIDIDFRSEATVRVVLATIPPVGLCDFSTDDLFNVYDAVLVAPGTAFGDTADEINAVAASIAAVDPGVDAAISAAVDRPASPTPTGVPSVVTPIGATPTRTEVIRRTETPTARATRTPGGTSPTPTTQRAPTRTPTSA
jgi:hypothetical protein